MRSATRFTLLLLLPATFAFAEEMTPEEIARWNWANFLLLAIALAYLMAKMLPPLFRSRSQEIVHDMAESRRIREEAEATAADVEKRLAAIDREIAALRDQSKEDSAAEAERVKKHTEQEIARIQSQSAREIGDAGRNAQMELKRFASSLAIDLAAQKLRARMTPANDERLVRAFVRDLQ